MKRSAQNAVMLLSLTVALLMLAGKGFVYFLTNSTAMLADAAESIVHVAATGFAAFSMWYAARPADATHPYGHGRIAYLSIGFEGTLVFATSLGVAYGGIMRLLHAQGLHHLQTGLLIAVLLAAINLMLGVSLVHVGKRKNSPIVTANGRHVLTDVWTTGAAIGGVGLVMVTGQPWLDPAAAILIAAFIMLSGVRLVRSSIAGLMDELDPAMSRRLIDCLEDAVRRERIAGFHQLRFRKLNDEVWIDVHLFLPGRMSLFDAHRRATLVETEIRNLFESSAVHVTTHVEPEEHDAAHPKGHEIEPDPLGLLVEKKR